MNMGKMVAAITGFWLAWRQNWGNDFGESN